MLKNQCNRKIRKYKGKETMNEPSDKNIPGENDINISNDNDSAKTEPENLDVENEELIEAEVSDDTPDTELSVQLPEALPQRETVFLKETESKENDESPEQVNDTEQTGDDKELSTAGKVLNEPVLSEETPATLEPGIIEESNTSTDENEIIEEDIISEEELIVEEESSLSPSPLAGEDETRELLLSFVGIDIGGTFTDAVLFADGKLEVLKTATRHDDPAGAVMELVNQFNRRNFLLTHGSTLATNAVLERKGEPTAFFATEGFRDMLSIARQNRKELFNLDQDARKPLVPSDLCYDVPERIDFMGDILTPIRISRVKEYLEELIEKKIRSLSVCLLFSYKNPDHERDIKIAAEGLPMFVSISSEVIPQYREYERASTTTLNAYVSPILNRYISQLENLLKEAGGTGFKIMESNGGILPAMEASSMGVRTLLSGPAGGVAGAFKIAEASGYTDILTLDMGGTSTDVALCEGEPGETTEGEIDGFPIALPMVDIVTIGAGGGSIAKVDEGGVLKVGPQSAGADPGPACYGKGEEATVTDAHMVLGNLTEKDFLGGEFPVSKERAAEAVSRTAGKLNITREQAATGIIKIALSHMERVMRVVTLERGKDPGKFTLIPFGGAGSLHAPYLAKNLGMKKILIPQHPGVLSALGMLLCDFRMDFTQSVLKLSDRINEREYYETMEELYNRTVEYLDRNRFQEVIFHNSFDLRYKGQSFELNIKGDSIELPGEEGRFSLPVIPQFNKEMLVEEFHNAHHQRYGFARDSEPVEIVNFRLKMVGTNEKPVLEAKELYDESPEEAFMENRDIITLDGEELSIPAYDREKLKPGNVIPSPAVIVQYDTVILIPRLWIARIDEFENIILEMEKEEENYEPGN